MKVKFKSYFMGVSEGDERTVTSFTRRALLDSEGRGQDERVRLEDQASTVAEAMGRLMDTLIAKGVLTQDEFMTVLGINYGRERVEVVPDD